MNFIPKLLFYYILATIAIFNVNIFAQTSGSDGTYLREYYKIKKGYGVLITVAFDVTPAFGSDDFSVYSTAFFAPANRQSLTTTLQSMLLLTLHLLIL